MDRLACVDLPFLPLQLLLRREPSWREQPAVVVESDGPQARIEYVNLVARSRGVLPGMRYAAGLTLEKDLKAATISPCEVEESLEVLHRALCRFAPGVEPAPEEPGVFWLDARGMERLLSDENREPDVGESKRPAEPFDSNRRESLMSDSDFEGWARQVQQALKGQSFLASVVVGFTRFGTYATARSRAGLVRVFSAEDEEQEQTRRTPLALLRLEPRSRDLLAKLGVRNVGELLDLPASGVRRRFGEEIGRLLAMARGTLREPFAPEALLEPLRDRRILDDAIERIDMLVLGVEQLLLPLLDKLDEQGRALLELQIELVFERLPARSEAIRPAEPTLEAGRLLGLVFLRLESLSTRGKGLPAGVIEIGLEVQGVALKHEQGELFVERPPRDLAAGNRALARLRARFGNESVVHAVLADGHLPEASFQWKPCEQIHLPTPRKVKVPSLVRRCYRSPIVLPARSRHEPDGWLLGGPETGSVTRLVGPYVVAGGWWNRGVHREYYFAEMRKGSIFWVYFDRLRRRWFVQGVVS